MKNGQNPQEWYVFCRKKFVRGIASMIVGAVFGLIATVAFISTSNSGEGLSNGEWGAAIVVFLMFTGMFGGAICLFRHLRFVVISFNVIFCIIFLIISLLGGIFVGVPLFIYDVVSYVRCKNQTYNGNSANPQIQDSIPSNTSEDNRVVVTITAMDGHIYQADLLTCFTAGENNMDYCAVLSHEEYADGTHLIQLFRYTLTQNNDGTETIYLDYIPSNEEYVQVKNKFESLSDG